MMKLDGDGGRKTYKTFPKRIVQASGISQKWPFLRWCCPFCFDKPIPPPLSRRGSRVPVIKVTRARTPDSDSDSEILSNGCEKDDQENEDYEDTEESKEPREKSGNIVYQRGYGKRTFRDRYQDRSKFDNYDLLSDDDFYQKQNVDSSSGVSSHVTSPDESCAGSHCTGTKEANSANEKTSFGFGFKGIFRKSKSKKSGASERMSLDPASAYGDVPKTKQRSRLFSLKGKTYSDKVKGKPKKEKSKPDSMGQKDDLDIKRTNTRPVPDDSRGSSDSEPLISSENPVAVVDDSLEFENLPLKKVPSLPLDDLSQYDGSSAVTTSSVDQSLKCSKESGEGHEVFDSCTLPFDGNDNGSASKHGSARARQSTTSSVVSRNSSTSTQKTVQRTSCPSEGAEIQEICDSPGCNTLVTGPDLDDPDDLVFPVDAVTSGVESFGIFDSGTSRKWNVDDSSIGLAENIESFDNIHPGKKFSSRK